jgi:beta-fructofuranosidase
MTCFSSSQGADGTYTLETVTLTPDPRLQQCRFRDLSPQQPFGDELFAFATAQSQLEIDLSFHINKPDRRIGFDILHSSDSSEYTRIYFDASSETLFIDRSKSTRLPGINVSPKKAPHTLFEMKKGETTVREDLEFHVFFDTSVLEVFVNGRVAITTRVYPEEGTCYGIRIYAGDNKEAAISKGSFDKKCETQASIAEPRRLNIWILAARVSSVD